LFTGQDLDDYGIEVKPIKDYSVGEAVWATSMFPSLMTDPLIIAAQDQIDLSLLAENPAYQAVIRQLREYESGMLASLKKRSDSREAMNHLRLWQVVSQVIDIMERAPNDARVAIDMIRDAVVDDPSGEWIDPIFMYRQGRPDTMEVDTASEEQ
jgi:hypothetical protein